MTSDNEQHRPDRYETETSGPDGGAQREYWRSFYQHQWDARRQFLEELIDAGETGVMRLIGLSEKYERKYMLEQVQTLIDGQECGRKVVSTRRVFEGELTPAGLPPFRTSSMLGQASTIPYHTPDSYVPFLVDVIDEIGPVDAVVELGCGYGRNLFSLYHAGGPGGIPYFGGELSEAAVALGRRLAALSPEPRVSIHPFDHLAPDLSFLPSVDHLFVFTVHSLEQVREIGQSFFRAVAGAAKRVSVIHLEPFGYQVRDQGPATRKQKEHFTNVGWNANLWSALGQAAESGILVRRYAALETFFPAAPGNPTSVLFWQSR